MQLSKKLTQSMTVPYRQQWIEVGPPLVACGTARFSLFAADRDRDPQFLRVDGSVNEQAAGLKPADFFNLIEKRVMCENANNSQVIQPTKSLKRPSDFQNSANESLPKGTTLRKNTRNGLVQGLLQGSAGRFAISVRSNRRLSPLGYGGARCTVEQIKTRRDTLILKPIQGKFCLVINRRETFQ
jgi:hypothetical protein